MDLYLSKSCPINSGLHRWTPIKLETHLTDDNWKQEDLSLICRLYKQKYTCYILLFFNKFTRISSKHFSAFSLYGVLYIDLWGDKCIKSILEQDCNMTKCEHFHFFIPCYKENIIVVESSMIYKVLELE